MTSRGLIITGLVLALLGRIPSLSGAQPAAAAGPEPSAFHEAAVAPALTVSFQGGLLFLTARDVEIREVLRAVAEKTGIGLTVGEGVGGKISLTFAGLSLEEALQRLCQSRAILYEYDPQTRIGRITGAGAFTAGTVARPPDPSGPASSHPGSNAKAAGQTPAAGPEEAPTGSAAAPSAAAQSGTQEGERLYDSQGRLPYMPRELLVRFLPEATEGQIADLHARLGSTVLKRLDRRRLHRVLLREGLTEQEGLTLYEVSPLVVAVERHALRYPLAPSTDPRYPEQWALPLIGMPAAWDLTTGKAAVVIGVIDTGVLTGHPDLQANLDLVQGWDFAGATSFPGDGDADPTDVYGHGTHVSGIIAAKGDNGIGVAGVGWNLKIMPLKVSYDQWGHMMTADILEALDYVREHQLRIVNLSIGGSTPSLEEYQKFSALRDAGILAFCAAGNGIDNTWPGVNLDASALKNYPAFYAHSPYEGHPALDNIVSVAASTGSALQVDQLWGGSNYGLRNVDLMAPGYDILSTCAPSTTTCSTDYAGKTGTSMATAHVSGVAGLILSRNPYLSYGRVKSAILDSVDKVSGMDQKLISGGRLNAAAALASVCLPGDLTGNGRVDLADVVFALQAAAGLDHGSGSLPCATADANRDDQIGLAEAIYGLKVLSGF